MLKGVGLVGAGALLGSGLTTLAGAPRENGIAQGAGSERPWYELGIIGESIMDNQLLWYLSHTGQGMADIGECLDTTGRIDRSEEHTSELQSRQYLVCRLLLEKKKKTKNTNIIYY